MTHEMLDIIETRMLGGRKGSPSARAARAVLVEGMTRPQAQMLYGVTRMALYRAIQYRQNMLAAALELAELQKKSKNIAK